METKISSNLITTSKLAELLESNTSNLIIIDGNFAIDHKSWIVSPPDTWDQTFKKERIPSARFINIAHVSDKSQGLPFKLPTVEFFTKTAKDLNISKNDHIVTYADDNLVGAARLWWMFRVFGFKDVQVLDGTFKKWKSEGLRIETGDETWKNNQRDLKDEDFDFKYNESLVAKMGDLKKLLGESKIDSVTIVDARSDEMFRGEADPKFGHIPSSKNIAFTEFLNLEGDGTLKTPEEIAKLIQERKIDLTKPIITTCRGGITSNVLSLGLTTLGIENIALYDGSWSEWIKYEDNPIEKGASK